MFPIRDSVPSRNVPIMMWLLIGLNVLVFIYEVALPDEAVETLVYRFGLVPVRASHPDWAATTQLVTGGLLPFLTSMFLHAGLFHVLANMWSLWIFGDNVEDRMGPTRFLFFYVICGGLAGLAHWVSAPASSVPTVGASGAVAGVMGGYLLLYPRARILMLLPIFFWPFFFEMPALLFLAYWFLTQILSAGLAGGDGGGGVAWWAHVGGFVAGMLLVRLFVRKEQPPPTLGPEEYGLGFRRAG